MPFKSTLLVAVVATALLLCVDNVQSGSLAKRSIARGEAVRGGCNFLIFLLCARENCLKLEMCVLLLAKPRSISSILLSSQAWQKERTIENVSLHKVFENGPI